LSNALDRIRTDRAAQAVLGAVIAYVVLYPLPGSPLPERIPFGVVAQGVIYGTSYALVAMGLILMYRTTRIVNFAYGAMGAMPGSLTVGLFLAKGVNYWLAILVGVAVGVATGAGVELLVIRRFTSSSRLVLTVATIGLAQILGAIGLGIGVALGTPVFLGNIDTPLSGSFFVRPYPIRGDHLLLLGAAPLILAGLGWFLLRTDAGRAVRAAAENEDRALLLGVPVRRLQTIVWALAGGLATITYVVKVPFAGVTPDPSLSATTILPGLAVAVIARFQSLPVALCAGIGLGIAEWTIRWNVTAESVFDVTFLVVILAALLLRRDHSSRAETGESSWDGAGILKPIPAVLRRVPEVRYAGVAFGVVGGFAVVLAALTAPRSTVVLMSFAVVWALVAVSLVVLTGWGGNISLGQFGIVGVGAMTAGEVMLHWNLDLFLGLLASIAVGALVAVLIGLPALRIRGLYLAVTTIAFAVALDSYFLNPVNFPGLVPSSILPPVLWKRFDLHDQRPTFFFCLGVLLLAVAAVRAVRGSRAGRAIIGTRDNERAAGAFAIPTTLVKLQTFVLSGCIAGLAGGLYVVVLAGAGQNTFHPRMSIEVFSFAVIGGLGSIAGAISGVLLFRVLDYVLGTYVSSQWATILRLSLTGGGLLFILYFLPGGLWQFVHRQRDDYLRWVAQRRGLLVPSLVADKRVVDEAGEDRPQDETAVISGALSP
jgi:branched-chain amino acid transport system permease protein